MAKALLTLSEVLHNAAGKTNPAVFQVLFERIGMIEGAATNLRGALFALVALNLVKLTSVGQPQLALNRIFNAAPDRKANVDVMAVMNRRWVRFVECKGYLANGLVPDDYASGLDLLRGPGRNRGVQSSRYGGTRKVRCRI